MSFRTSLSSRPIWIASDLHLSESTPIASNVFCSLLRLAVYRSAHLILLGDTFDFWVGDDIINFAPEWLNVILNKLKAASAQIPIWLARGNRDFLLGDNIAAISGSQILSDPTFLHTTLGSIAISHGDKFCTQDKQYQDFRSMVRNKKWQEKFLEKPISERLKIFDQVRQISLEQAQKKTKEILDIDLETVKSFFRSSGVDILIHGHTHRPNQQIMEIDGKKCERWVLCDWEFDVQEKRKKGSYLAIEKSGIRKITLNPNLQSLSG